MGLRTAGVLLHILLVIPALSWGESQLAQEKEVGKRNEVVAKPLSERAQKVHVYRETRVTRAQREAAAARLKATRAKTAPDKERKEVDK